MEIVRIVGIGIVALVVIVLIKQYRPEFAIYVSLCVGVLIFFMIADKLSGIVGLISGLADKASVNMSFVRILLKITGIAILTEFACSVCTDAGESAIAHKIDLGGKVIIVSISIPIISAVLESLLEILP